MTTTPDFLEPTDTPATIELDFAAADRLLTEAHKVMARYHGYVGPQEPDLIEGTSARAQARAARGEMTKDLLFTIHLIDKARALVGDHYWTARGRTTHLIEE